MSLESGYYWVREWPEANTEWTIAEYRADEDEWWYIGCEYSQPIGEDALIGPRIPQYEGEEKEVHP